MFNRLNSRQRSGMGKWPVLVAVVAVVAVAYGAYRVLFNRTGEAAIQLIPQDAQVVVTLDTNPSESQVQTFKRIYDALDKEGIAAKIDSGLTEMFNRDPLGKNIRQYVTTNFAFASFGSGPKTSYVVLTSVKDAGKVRDELNRSGKQVSDNPATFRINNLGSFCAVIGDYLAVSESQESLARIESVRAGHEAPLAQLPEYQSARAALPNDANLMVFISPTGLKELQKALSSGNLASATWMTIGATIREDGLQFDYRGPINAKSSSAMNALTDTQPLDLQVLSELPINAYGIFAYSQVGRYWDVVKGEIHDKASVAQEFDEGLAKFEKETNLSVERDIVPAFMGKSVFAVYPGATGKVEDLDYLVLIDDKNGADPAALLQKLRVLADKKSKESGEKFTFVESTIGDTTIWEVDDATRQKIVKDVKGAPGIDNKTLVLAQMGKGIVAATSKDLISRAIAARHGGASLAADPAFVAMNPRIISGSQTVFMVNVRRIMDALRPKLAEELKKTDFQIDDIVNLFGSGDAGLVGSGRFDRQTGIGTTFVPLDFERAIHLMGESMRGMSEGKDVPARRIMD